MPSDANEQIVVLVRELVERLEESRLPLVLKKRAAMRELGMGKTELEARIKSGEIETVRYSPNGQVRIPSSSVIEFLAQKKRDSMSAHGAPATAKRPARMVRAGSVSAAEQEVEKLRALRAKRRRR